MEENKSDVLEIIEDKSTLESVIEHHKYLQSKGNYSYLALATFYILIAVIGIANSSALATTISLATALVLFLVIALNNANIKKFSKNAFEKGRDSDAKFMVYDDHIEYIVTKNSRQEKFLYIRPDKIENVAELKNSYVFQYDIISFSVVKSAVDKDSAFYKILFKDETAQKCNKVKEIQGNKMTELLTLVSSCLILFHMTVGKSIGAWWLPIVYAIVPITTFVALIIQKINKFKVPTLRMYLSVGMALLMFAFAMSAKTETVSNDFTDYNNAVLSKISAACDIELPVVEEIYVEEFKTYDEGSKTFIDATEYSLYLNQNQTLDYCNYVENNPKWSGTVSEDLMAYFGEFAELYLGDVISIYNATEKNYNSLPTAEEPCEYFVFYFDSRYSCIDVVTFTK